jgi:hypothetical protein
VLPARSVARGVLSRDRFLATISRSCYRVFTYDSPDGVICRSRTRQLPLPVVARVRACGAAGNIPPRPASPRDDRTASHHRWRSARSGSPGTCGFTLPRDTVSEQSAVSATRLGWRGGRIKSAARTRRSSGCRLAFATEAGRRIDHQRAILEAIRRPTNDVARRRRVRSSPCRRGPAWQARESLQSAPGSSTHVCCRRRTAPPGSVVCPC